jgi:hypothetical protein
MTGDKLPDEIPSGVRWMTYVELAKALGIDPESANRRARRQGWRRRMGNDHRTRVAVPRDALPDISPEKTRPLPPVSGDDPGDIPPDISRTIKALEGEAAVRREALQRERERADRIEAEAAQLREEREAARVQAARAEGDALALRETLAREEARAAEAVRQAAMQMEAEVRRREEAQALREVMQAELSVWTAGGPLARAWRAFTNPRGG